MMETLISAVIAVIFGVALPYAGIRMLAAALEEGPRVENYRGRLVFAGLGIVWLFWAIGVVVGELVKSMFVSLPMGGVPVLQASALLALAAFCLGLIDDAYGTAAEKGFRGHLRALARGRLTTGGLKLLGISVVSYFVAYWTSAGTQSGSYTGGWLDLAVALVPGAAIALTANFLNLTDLRPGRALKAYSVLGVVPVALVALVSVIMTRPFAASALGYFAEIIIFLIGPVVAVWRYDLGERGMLGDAGANAAGAVAGLMIVLALPLWGIVIYLLVMLALNIASERVSFSEVIERTPVLRRIDAWGRLDAKQIAARPSRPRERSDNGDMPHSDSPE